MKLWVYLNSAFLLRAAIGFSRRLTLAGEASYSFSLYSIICCISCTYFHLMLVSGSFRKKPPHPRFFYYPVSSKNEGNLEVAHDSCKTIGRNVDSFDVLGLSVERCDGLLKCIKRSIDRIAAGAQAKPVSRDLPPGAQLI